MGIKLYKNLSTIKELIIKKIQPINLHAKMKEDVKSLFCIFGYVDLTGNEIIHYKWESNGYFRDGLASAKDSKRKWGFIDKNGREVIPCQWEDNHHFSGGLAAVQDSNYRWGFIDKTGKVVLPCKWHDVVILDNGKVRAQTEKYDSWYDITELLKTFKK